MVGNNRFVVDANILFNAILNQAGDTHRLLFSHELSFVVPDFLLGELDKYQHVFLKRDILYMEYVQNFLLRDVKLYQMSLLKDIVKETTKKMEQIDTKDSVYVALAEKLHIPLWTNDKDVLQQVDRIQTVDTTWMISQFG